MRAYATRRLGKTPPATSQSVSKSMKSNKSFGTKPELVLSKLLRKKICKNNFPGRPDFIYPKKKLAVFLHGCYWHHCPKCKLPLPKTHHAFWRRKFERNVERDILNRKELRRLGWNVIEVWEHDIKDNPYRAVEKIRMKLV